MRHTKEEFTVCVPYLGVDPQPLAKDLGELLAHVYGSSHRPAVDEVSPTPGGVFSLLPHEKKTATP